MPLNIDWQQILLHLFNFTILFAVLYFLLYKPVKQFMDKRTEYYRQLDDAANQKLAAAAETEAEHARRLLAVDEEIAANKEKSRKELDAFLAERKAQSEQEASKLLADASEVARMEREKILKDAQREIADMVTTATEKIISSADTTSDAFDQFLATAQRGEHNE